MQVSAGAVLMAGYGFGGKVGSDETYAVQVSAGAVLMAGYGFGVVWVCVPTRERGNE